MVACLMNCKVFYRKQQWPNQIIHLTFIHSFIHSHSMDPPSVTKPMDMELVKMLQHVVGLGVVSSQSVLPPKWTY
jgi:hypothetical protein